jgi:CHAD domain-containing protein
MSLDALLDTYRVDIRHARQVADHALALFDAVAERYGLKGGERRLLEVGALLHNVGLTTNPKEHHLVGRDIVLHESLDELSAPERAVLACVVAFHRKRVRPRLEPAYLSLGKKRRKLALRLAAILRVADGLDYSQSQGTQLLGLEHGAGGITLRLGGPLAAADGERAVAKADLWAKEFGEKLHAAYEAAAVQREAQSDHGDEREQAELAPWYADPEAPLAELGRVLLRRNFRRLLASEREARAEEAAEAIHELRVATRRLRAMLRMVAPVAPQRGLRRHAKTIGRLARAAGAVRDRDVLAADLAERGPALPEELRPAIAALRDSLLAERRAAHEALLEACASDEHSAFREGFAAAIVEPDGWDEGPRVRDLAGSNIWRHYEALRAHDRGGLPADEEALHTMRIDGKRMRYVLELFAETMGPRSDEALSPLVAFQNHLGSLNDLSVARALLAPFAADEAAAPAVAAYLALREQEAAKLVDELPARWGKLNSGTYRRRLMELIVKL